MNEARDRKVLCHGLILQEYYGGVGRYFIKKCAKNFSELVQKFWPKKFLPLPSNRQKTEMISLSYDDQNQNAFKRGIKP